MPHEKSLHDKIGRLSDLLYDAVALLRGDVSGPEQIKAVIAEAEAELGIERTVNPSVGGKP